MVQQVVQDVRLDVLQKGERSGAGPYCSSRLLLYLLSPSIMLLSLPTDSSTFTSMRDPSTLLLSLLVYSSTHCFCPSPLFFLTLYVSLSLPAYSSTFPQPSLPISTPSALLLLLTCALLIFLPSTPLLSLLIYSSSCLAHLLFYFSSPSTLLLFLSSTFPPYLLQ